MGSDHPVIADHTFERDQLPLVLLVGGVCRDVDVVAAVEEDRSTFGAGQTIAGFPIETEGVSDLGRVLLGRPVNIDPKEFRAAQPARTLVKVFQLFNLIAVEDDRSAHPTPLG